MHSMNVMFAYMAPQPFLPLTSVLAVLVGVVLMFGRNTLRVVPRWVRPATIRRTQRLRKLIPPRAVSRRQEAWIADRLQVRQRGQMMPIVRKGFHPAVGENTGPGSQRRAGGLFLTTLWFGLLAGWLELGLVLAQRAINPHVSIDTLRTNRHFVWMIPVSDVLIFGVVGLSIALLARFRPGLARWTALRLPVGLSFLTLLLTIEGLYAIAA